MEDTWGIPEPTFTGIYLLGFSMALLFAFAVRILTRSGAAAATAAAADEALSAQDFACLNGGPRRVVEAAVAQLVATGQLRASHDGYLQVADRSSGTDPVERTVLADVARHGRRSTRMLIDRLAAADAVGEVTGRLVRAGYLVDDVLAARRKLIGLIPVVTVFSIGLVRWLSEIANDRPVGWLTVLLIGSGLIAYALYRQSLCPRTFEGSHVMSRAQALKKADGEGSRTEQQLQG
jgi:uncharacterized protein (TIGR04222 family)